MPNSPPTTNATYAKLVVVPAIWGGTFIAGRILALAVPAAVGALLRYVVAVVALLVAARWLEGGLPRLTRRQVLGTVLLGLTGILAYNLFFLGALARLPASRTSLIIALNPIVTISVANAFAHPYGVAGRNGVCSFCGLVSGRPKTSLDEA